MKRFFIKTALLVSALTLCQAAQGWGWTHRLIAYMALRHCTETTRAELDRYLDVPITGIAEWMDAYRDYDWGGKDWSEAPDYVRTTHWHMASVDENGEPCMVSQRKDGNGIAVPMLQQCWDKMKNYKQMTDSAVVVNIKYIVHVAGDMHCPAHCYYAKLPAWPKPENTGLDSRYGWFPCTYNGKTTTYHSMWDGAPERVHPEFEKRMDRFTDHIDTLSVTSQRAAIAGKAYDWGKDNAVFCWQIYELGYGPGATFTDEFYRRHGWIAIRQVQYASYRLAHVLNDIFDPNYRGL